MPKNEFKKNDPRTKANASKGGTASRKKPGKPGPKSKLDKPEVQKALLDAFAYDATEEEACFYAEIDVSTLARYKKKHPKFAERIQALRQTPVLAARRQIVNSAKTDPKWSAWYLERKKKDEFALRHELTGPEGRELSPITMFDLGIKPKKQAK